MRLATPCRTHPVLAIIAILNRLSLSTTQSVTDLRVSYQALP